MKKLVKIFIIVFFLLSAKIKEVNAFDFFKYKNNPLEINLINNYAYVLQVDVYQKDNNGCFAVASARRSGENYFSLIKIESSDCLNWKMTKEILNIGQDITNPRVFIDDNNQINLFFAKQDAFDFYRIYKTNCDEQFNCSSDLKLVLDPNRNLQDEIHGYFAPKVIKNEGIYYMFYGVWGNNGFKIRLAYSDNLDNWQKCSNNLLADNSDGPFPLIYNNFLYLFYHRSDSTGIKLAKANLPIRCDLNFQDFGYLLQRGDSYDARHLIFPSVLLENNNFKIFYSGLNLYNQWTLNLACENYNCSFYFPTPTPIPTKIPLIILPGFMGSWNKEAILYNREVSYNSWKLAPFVKEYDGIINTLKKIGYKENEDFYIFAYDWRKPIEETAENLNLFLNSLLSSTVKKFNLVGHSLGGLISRIYTQKYKDKVNKIISVGSPHKGAVQVYKPIEAGEIDRENTFLWLAQKIILVLNKSSFESDKETMKKKLPILLDLFPVFDFLKNNSGETIPVNSLSLKNNLLNFYNQNFSEIFDVFISIYGEKDNKTPAGFIIEPPNFFDQLFGNYQDGHPKSYYYDWGDYTVLSKSSKEDEDSQKLILDHGEIITKKEAIKKILELLGINYQEDNIVEGKKTNIAKSLIFLVKSPAKMKVKYNENVYEEDDGIIFIPDAQTGEYQLDIQGTDFGDYQVIVGQISENNDVWDYINGRIYKDPPQSQIDTYFIKYNELNSYSIFPSPTPTILPTITPSFSSTTSNQSSSSQNSSNNSKNNISSSKKSSELSFFKSSLSLLSKQKSDFKNETNNQVLGKKTINKNINNKNIFQNKSEFSKKKNWRINLSILLIILILLTLYFYKKFKIKN